jgi:hypothetical protein
LAAEQAEGAVGDEPARDRSDQGAAVPDPARGQQPERDAVEDEQQREDREHGRQRPTHPGTGGFGERGEPAPRRQQQVERGDEGEALHDLDGQAGGEGAPPPAGYPVG